MTQETFEQRKTEDLHQIAAVLSRYLPGEEGRQKAVTEAMNYSVHAGGKRLRPMLMLETYRMFGGADAVIEPFLSAIEMIHTYSLVHDDLPAMDNDLLRRGKPTTHAKYGETLGILAGDALLNFSMETAVKAFALTEDTDAVARALTLLYDCAGIYGMIGGQTVDVETDRTKTIDRDTLDFIYRLKTGALLEASMGVGAILGGADEQELSAIREAARLAGLAFQIRDDILDEISTEEELGKPIGSDAKNGKATYVTFEGLEKSEQDVKRFSDEAVAVLRSLNKDSTFLEALLLSLVDRRS